MYNVDFNYIINYIMNIHHFYALINEIEDL